MAANVVGQDDQRPLKPGGKIFDLSVAIRVIGIRGLGSHPDAHHGKGGSHHIDNGFQCIGQHRRGAGQVKGIELNCHQHHGNRQRDADRCHAELEKFTAWSRCALFSLHVRAII